jgi:hypothetical protein
MEALNFSHLAQDTSDTLIVKIEEDVGRWELCLFPCFRVFSAVINVEVRLFLRKHWCQAEARITFAREPGTPHHEYVRMLSQEGAFLAHQSLTTWIYATTSAGISEMVEKTGIFSAPAVTFKAEAYMGEPDCHVMNVTVRAHANGTTSKAWAEFCDAALFCGCERCNTLSSDDAADIPEFKDLAQLKRLQDLSTAVGHIAIDEPVTEEAA